MQTSTRYPSGAPNYIHKHIHIFTGAHTHKSLIIPNLHTRIDPDTYTGRTHTPQISTGVHKSQKYTSMRIYKDTMYTPVGTDSCAFTHV